MVHIQDVFKDSQSLLEVIRPAEEGKLEVSYRWFRTCKDAVKIKRMYVRP